MKPAVILLLSTDAYVERLAREAVTATRHGLRVIQSTPQAFHELGTACDDVDLAIVDLDPGMHGAALLEAIGDRLPVIVLTSLEGEYMKPVASRHGARECLTKPFRAEQLQAALKRALPIQFPT
jgi:DNA-binding response OmpR family regulator